MKLIFVVGLSFGVALTWTSCKSEKKTEAPAVSESKKKPSHPWDWEPTDAALEAGKVVYLSECASCHDEGEEGAPALTKAEEWAERETKGMATLFDHAINGYDGFDGEMPARGGTPSLTDEEVKNAVSFMIKAPK